MVITLITLITLKYYEKCLTPTLTLVIINELVVVIIRAITNSLNFSVVVVVNTSLTFTIAIGLVKIIGIIDASSCTPGTKNERI